MSTEVTIKVHEIAVDGLPDLSESVDGPISDMVVRIAFIFDGCVVSGWPLRRAEDESGVLWEGDSDVANSRPKSGVTHWIEFPVPLSDLGKPAEGNVRTEEPPAEESVALELGFRSGQTTVIRVRPGYEADLSESPRSVRWEYAPGDPGITFSLTDLVYVRPLS